MNSKITIGVTGGIGSGKSIICRIISTMGYPVFYADNEAKSILVENEEVRTEIFRLFGEKAYQGKLLNREFIASKIFDNKDLRTRMNAIVHPRVGEAFKKWMSEQESDIVFDEAAILFETGSYKNFNHTILVTAPEELRITRVMSRDKVSRDKVLSRMATQWPEEKKISMADFIIKNDDKSLVIPQVLKTLDAINKIHENL